MSLYVPAHWITNLSTNQLPGTVALYYATVSSVLSDFITDRLTIGGEDMVPGNQLQHQQQEVQQYYCALSALIEKICHCNKEELQELLRSIQNTNSLAEAVQQALDLEYS